MILTHFIVLLDQAPSFSEQASNSKPTVLLTNDLTKPVVDEALEKGTNVIVCYRELLYDFFVMSRQLYL